MPNLILTLMKICYKSIHVSFSPRFEVKNQKIYLHFAGSLSNFNLFGRDSCLNPHGLSLLKESSTVGQKRQGQHAICPGNHSWRAHVAVGMEVVRRSAKRGGC